LKAKIGAISSEGELTRKVSERGKGLKEISESGGTKEGGEEEKETEGVEGGGKEVDEERLGKDRPATREEKL
jgi:hypothetical protein